MSYDNVFEVEHAKGLYHTHLQINIKMRIVFRMPSPGGYHLKRQYILVAVYGVFCLLFTCTKRLDLRPY